jgi:hypothetical protein
VLLCLSDFFFSSGWVIHHCIRFEAPSAERQFADLNVIEGNTVEGGFRHFTVNVGQGKSGRSTTAFHLFNYQFW